MFCSSSLILFSCCGSFVSPPSHMTKNPCVIFVAWFHLKNTMTTQWLSLWLTSRDVIHTARLWHGTTTPQKIFVPSQRLLYFFLLVQYRANSTMFFGYCTFCNCVSAYKAWWSCSTHSHLYQVSQYGISTSLHRWTKEIIQIVVFLTPIWQWGTSAVDFLKEMFYFTSL